MSTRQVGEIGKLIREGQAAFGRRLHTEQIDSARRLIRSYKTIKSTLDDRLKDFRIIAQEQGMTARALSNEASAVRLRETVQQSLDGLRPAIRQEALRMQASGIQAGLGSGSFALDATVKGTFREPSISQMAVLVNYVDGPAFQNTLANYGAAHAQHVTDIILAGASKGKNPLAVATQIRNYLSDFPLADAIRLTRTVQIYSARQATHQMYRDNRDIVQGWIWSGTLGPNECVSCYAMEGSFHGVDEELNDHHSGECAPVPVTTSWADLGFGGGSEATAGIQTGEAIFSALPDSEQRQIMGTARWNAWQDGLFNFDDLSTTYQDAIFGTMRKAASLDELVGPDVGSAYKRPPAA